MELKSGKEWPLNTAYNGDCLTFMKELPDKCIDLVLTDPPYGVGDISKITPRAKGNKVLHRHKSTDWNVKPDKIMIDEILRISKNQIIWGANYFSSYLPDSRGWIFWDKKYENTNNFSAGELAWT